MIASEQPPELLLYFKKSIPEIKDPLFKANNVLLPFLKKPKNNAFFNQTWKKINKYSLNALRYGGIPFLPRKIIWWYFRSTMIKEARKDKTLIEIEKSLRKIMRKNFSKDKDKIPNLNKRALRSFNKIYPFLKGESVLDLGAGDGLLGETILRKTSKKVILYDIIDYNYSSLPMNIYPENGTIELPDNSIDTTILYTVLHHASNPLHVLDEAIRVTKKRIIIVEGFVDTKYHYLFNSFFDWFLNRVAKDEDVPIPLNYLSTIGWTNLFTKKSLKLNKKIFLGVDEPVAPEYHMLYVLDK